MALALFVLNFGQSSRALLEERRMKGNPLRAVELLHRRIHLAAVSNLNHWIISF
jgi:hypothetical protein